MLANDDIALSYDQSFRIFRWVDLYLERHEQQYRPQKHHIRDGRPDAEKAIKEFLDRRDCYLQIEYYRDRAKIEESPILICPRQGFSRPPDQRLKPSDRMIRRANRVLEEGLFLRSSGLVFQGRFEAGCRSPGLSSGRYTEVRPSSTHWSPGRHIGFPRDGPEPYAIPASRCVSGRLGPASPDVSRTGATTGVCAEPPRAHQ